MGFKVKIATEVNRIGRFVFPCFPSLYNDRIVLRWAGNPFLGSMTGHSQRQRGEQGYKSESLRRYGHGSLFEITPDHNNSGARLGCHMNGGLNFE